jgi:hypothetical protein
MYYFLLEKKTECILETFTRQPESVRFGRSRLSSPIRIFATFPLIIVYGLYTLYKYL